MSEEHNRNTQHTQLETREGRICPIPARWLAGKVPQARSAWAGTSLQLHWVSRNKETQELALKLHQGWEKGGSEFLLPQTPFLGAFPSEYSNRQRGKTFPLAPSQHCQNMHQTPVYSGRRGLGVRAKPQPSAMLNQARCALAWPLSPFLLPKLVQKGSTEQLWGLFLHPMACAEQTLLLRYKG